MPEFTDLQISAWLTKPTEAQVMVNASPVGAMRKPETAPVEIDSDRELQDDHELGWPGSQERAIELGKSLAATLLPPPVHSYLLRSLERVPEDDGVRVRVSLDRSLADLPWEFLYRPDAEDASLLGFLALDSRISLVREATRFPRHAKRRSRRQRAILAGAFTAQGSDPFLIEKEFSELRALGPLQELLVMESIQATEQDIERALSKEAAIFHYAGHADVLGGRGYLVSEMGEGAERLFADQLAGLLREAGVRLAVFNACNGGRWSFVEPIIKAGIPAVIGARGYVSSEGAVAFAQKLYSSLAVGMSLDEAMSWTRLHLVEAGFNSGTASLEWGTFMAYAPTADSVLLPRPPSPKVRELQEATRQDRKRTIINVYQQIGTVSGQVTGVGSIES